MNPDFIQKTLKALRPDTPNWYSWAKVDSDGNAIPNDQRMRWEHVVVIQDGVTKPTTDEFNAKYAEVESNYNAEQARSQRDKLLSSSDWIVTKSLESGAAVPQEWLDYRQALRDVPQQSGFPDDITWPTAPNEETE